MGPTFLIYLPPIRYLLEVQSRQGVRDGAVCLKDEAGYLHYRVSPLRQLQTAHQQAQEAPHLQEALAWIVPQTLTAQRTRDRVRQRPTGEFAASRLTLGRNVPHKKMGIKARCMMKPRGYVSL